MKIITYNLHKGRAPRGRRSILRDVAAALVERAPDVLLCQEVFHTSDESERQCETLSGHLRLEHRFGPNRFYWAGCHGNATFTRFVVRQAVNLEITHSAFEHRGILHTRLNLEHYSLEVYNTHFSLTARQRRKQLQTLLEALPKDADVPVLLAGDFNDWGGGLDRLIERRRHFRNALHRLVPRERATYPARLPVFALDRIYYRGFSVLDVRVLRGPPWNQLSDHLPVEAEMIPVLSEEASPFRQA